MDEIRMAERESGKVFGNVEGAYQSPSISSGGGLYENTSTDSNGGVLDGIQQCKLGFWTRL